MVVRRDTASDNDPLRRIRLGSQLIAGCVAVVAAAFVATTLFSIDALPARLLVMAGVVGVYAAVVPDTRATLGVTLVAIVVFTGFLAQEYRESTTRDGDVWWYDVMIGFTAVLGLAYGWMGRDRPTHEPADATTTVSPPGIGSPGV